MLQQYLDTKNNIPYLLKTPCNFLSIDDKHNIKLGEPGFPVAAAEREKRLIVSCDASGL